MKSKLFNGLAAMAMALVLAVVPGKPAYAEMITVDTSKLTNEQAAAIKGVVTPPVSMMAQVEEFGAGAAKGIIAFTSELGMVANEFISTPAGAITAAVMLMYFAGAKIISFVIGALFLFVLFPAGLYASIRRTRPIEVVTAYKSEPRFFGLTTRLVPSAIETRHPFKYESDGFIFVAHLLATAIFLWIGLAFII